MSQIYGDYRFKVTTSGHNLLAALMATGKGLEITRVAVGSGRVEADRELADMTDLVEYVADAAIAAREHDGDELHLTVQYASNMTPGLGMFYLSEFVVEAKHPVTGESVNLLYATLGDYIQPVRAYSEVTAPDVRNYPLTIIVSSDIEVTVSAAGGLVTYDELNDAVDTAVKEALDELQPGWSVCGIIQLVLPADGWERSGDGSEDYNYICDVEAEGVTSIMIPLGGPLPGYFGIAQRAEMLNSCNVLNGKIRFMAKKVPEDKIVCKINLLRMGGSGGGGGNVDPGVGLGWGMDGRLNVLLGDGLSADEENKINVNHEEVVTDTDMVDEEEAKRDIERILNGDDAENDDA